MKNLKKLFSLMAVVTLMVMTVAVVTSCSDDDKEPEKVPTYAAMGFNFAVDKSLLEVVDVTIQYYKDGVVKTEVMNSEHWDDTLTKTSSKMPNTLGLKITMALKDGVTLDKEAYNMVTEVIGKPSVYFFDQNGYEMSSKYKETNGTVRANISKDDFIEAVKNFKYEYVVKVNGYNQVEEVTNPTW